MAALSGCIQEQPSEPISPLIPPEPPDNPQILSASWTADVFRSHRKVIITPPKRGLDKKDLQILGDYFGVEPGSPDLSILAGDVVEILPDNTTFTSSAVGAFIPGQVRTTFNVAIKNRLTAVNIITPTFPAPPPGTSGVILFPFEIVVTQTPGGATVDPDHTTVLVELPNRGLVAPSVDWDVSPFNFFNDAGCGATSNDCYRSETFLGSNGTTPVIQGGATSQSRNIGFDHDPTVSQFRVRMILAGDLEDATPNTPPTANAGGPYTTPRSVPVTLQGSGTDPDPGASLSFAWDFDADGQYDDATGANPSFTCPAGGSFTVSLRVTDNRSATAFAAAQVNCTDGAPTANANGPYFGTVGSPVTVSGTGTDDGVITAFAWDLDNDGQFDDAATASAQFQCTVAGTFTIRLQVTDNATPTPQTGVASTTVTCGAAAAGDIRARWVNAAGAPITSAAAGSQIFLELDIQMAGSNNVDSFQGRLNWTSTRLVLTDPVNLPGTDLNCSATGGQASCPSGAPPVGNIDRLNQFTPQLNAPAGVLGMQNFSQSGNGTGIQGIAKVDFTVGSGTAGGVAPTLTLLILTGNGGTTSHLTVSPAAPIMRVNGVLCQTSCALPSITLN
jgi:PKD repeat protein